MAVPAIAQQQPLPRVERPYRGLFGGGVGDAEQLLTVDLKTGGGYDHIISAGAPAGSPDSVDSTPWQNGGFGNFAAALGYSLNRERITVDATLASDNYFYPGSGSDFFGSYSGSVGPHSKQPASPASQFTTGRLISRISRSAFSRSHSACPDDSTAYA